MRKRSVSLILALVLVLSLLTISAAGAEKRPWEDPYRQLIKDTVGNQGGWSIDLVDLDYDGSPELLMARYPGSGLFQIIEDAYTFRNGTAQKLHTKGEYDDFFRFYEGTYEGEKLKGFTTWYNAATGQMKTEGYYLVRSGAAEHGMVFATAALNGTELSQQVLFAESTLTQTDTTTYYIGDQKVTHAAYTAAFRARNDGWTNVTPNGNPTMGVSIGAKVKDADIDKLFAAWAGGFHTVGSFKDVLSTDYFADAVQWAATHDPIITDGTSDTTFSPNNDCTRAQVVTFLWRAMGCPEPTSTNNPFKDVNASDYYGKAVLWAVENKITDGMSDGVFAPDATVTRGQVVTFLWRTEQEPTVAEANPFSDVAQSEYYFNAVLWALANQITDGTTDTTFSPNDPCTRCQIVTFLYRDMGE